jgi:pyruvate kinase
VLLEKEVSTMTISDPLRAWAGTERAFASLRRTKIVATLGPSTDGQLDDLIAAGMDCARLNCSHSSRDELIRRTAELRASATAAGRPVAVMFDLQGPKIRLAGDTAPRTLQAGEEVALSDPGNDEHDALTVAYDGFCGLLTDRSEAVIGDGVPPVESC